MSSKDASSDDAHNVENSGDWDHGVEPNALDAAGAAAGQLARQAKIAAAQAKTAITNAVHALEEKAAAAQKDLKESHLREEVEGHTEEEVAGMKLCVSKTVHQESFEAPC